MTAFSPASDDTKSFMVSYKVPAVDAWFPIVAMSEAIPSEDGTACWTFTATTSIAAVATENGSWCNLKNIETKGDDRDRVASRKSASERNVSRWTDKARDKYLFHQYI